MHKLPMRVDFIIEFMEDALRNKILHALLNADDGSFGGFVVSINYTQYMFILFILQCGVDP